MVLHSFSSNEKSSSVNPTHEIGKPLKSQASFRIISLIYIDSKLFKRIIPLSLLFFLESNCILSSHQVGFRPGQSTVDQIFIIPSPFWIGLKNPSRAIWLSLLLSTFTRHLTLSITCSIPQPYFCRPSYSLCSVDLIFPLWQLRLCSFLKSQKSLLVNPPRYFSRICFSHVLFSLFIFDLSTFLPSQLAIFCSCPGHLVLPRLCTCCSGSLTNRLGLKRALVWALVSSSWLEQMWSLLLFGGSPPD